MSEKVFVGKSWFGELKFKNGRIDMPSIVILAELFTSFEGDLIQRSYDSLANELGLSKRQVRDAIKRLEDKGLLTKHFKTIKENGLTQSNVLFIELHLEKIDEITY